MSIPGSVHPLFALGKNQYEIQRSLRFNSSDSAYLSRTPSTAGNRKTWTWSAWLKRTNLGYQMIFSSRSGAEYHYLDFDTNDELGFRSYSGSFQLELQTTAKHRDPSAWYHILVNVDTTAATPSNRASIYVNGTKVTTFNTATYPSQNTDLIINTTYEHNFSRFPVAGDLANFMLAEVHFIDGAALTPSSFTETDATTGQLVPKTYTGSYGTNGYKLTFSDNSNNTAATLGADSSGRGNNWTPSSNISVIQGNGNYVPYMSSSGSLTFGTTFLNGFDGNVNNGVFGPTGGTMTFSPSPAISYATSVEVITSGDSYSQASLNGGSAISTPNNTWTTLASGSGSISSIVFSDYAGSQPGFAAIRVDGVILVDYRAASANDSLVDTPTNYGADTGVGGEVRGNYCTLNPLSTSSGTYSQGNLRFVGANSWMNSNGTFAVSTGKWYYEVTVANDPYSPRSIYSEYNGFGWGVSNVQAATTTSRTQSDAIMYSDNGYYKNFTGSYTDGGAVSSGDVLAIAVDLDANTFYLYKNNSQIATGTIGGTAGRELTPRIVSYNGSYGALDVNFGQRPFAYTKSGYKALCTQNLTDSLGAQPSTVMDVVTYNGSSGTKTITMPGGFSPDLVWIKNRGQARWHNVFDQVRGAYKRLFTNNTSAETNDVGYNLNSFTSTGFTLLDTDRDTNSSAGDAYVAWCWDAGSSTVTNTQGSITSSVRANASSGFAVITGSTPSLTVNFSFGHNLGIAPSMVIYKHTAVSGNWQVYHRNGGGNNYNLNSTAGPANSGLWSGLDPTSTLITIPSTIISTNSSAFVCYAWAPVAGYSSFGSYTGNYSADGPFVFTGFRPRWIMIKRITTIQNWYIFDAVRNTYNAAGSILEPNLPDFELDYPQLDILSSGFKLRGTDSGWNASGSNYVFASFAEAPFKYARAR